jgi:hypothetical protein
MKKYRVKIFTAFFMVGLFLSMISGMVQARMPGEENVVFRSMREVKENSSSAGDATQPATPNSLVSRLSSNNVPFVLDDGSNDNNIGASSKEFIFLNRFTPLSFVFPFQLEEIQVYFSSDGFVNIGDDILLVVYENILGDVDPSTGSNFLESYPAKVEVLDDWNSYFLDWPLTLNGPGDVIIGVIALERPEGSYYPAALDESRSKQRSWAGVWISSPPPEVPNLPPDESWTMMDDVLLPGNWMIRGYGTTDITIQSVYMPVVLR